MATFFNQILDAFKGSFTRKAEGLSVVGLDISSTAIKAVQLRRDRGRAILETYGEVFLGPYGGLAAGQAVTLPAPKLAEALVDLCKGAKITAQRVGVAVPLRSSLISLIELPSVGEKQLNEMIPIEARKYIPVPISEVTLDWWVIPKRETDNTKVEVLMVAIHQATLAQYKELAAAAQLKPELFEIESFSAIRAVAGKDMIPTMIIDLGASSTKITIVDYGIIRVSHVVARGAQDITFALSKSLSLSFDEAEKIKRDSGISGQMGADKNISSVASSVVEFVFFEANKVLAAYQKKYNRAVGRAILIGGGALLKGISEVAGHSLEIPTVLGDPFSKVEAPAFLENVLLTVGPEFAVALGIALREMQDL